jgi:hypothetical protein
MSTLRGKDPDSVARCVQTYPKTPLAKSAEFFCTTVLIPGLRGRRTCTDADSVRMKSCRENKRNRTNIYRSITLHEGMCTSLLYNSSIYTSRRSLTLQRRMAKGIARSIQVHFISSFGFPCCFIRSIQILVTRSGIK